MSRKIVRRLCDNGMRQDNDLKRWEPNLKDRDAL